MMKFLAVLFTALMTIASVSGYVFLNTKITDGEKKMAEGRMLIEKRLPELSEGKAELAAGKQTLSAGKQEYQEAYDNKLLVLADTLMNSGKGFAEGREKIAAGEQKVAQGEDKVRVGEQQLATGTMALHQGDEQLKIGKDARFACAVAAVFFGILSLALGFFWRRSLAEFIHKRRSA